MLEKFGMLGMSSDESVNEYVGKGAKNKKYIRQKYEYSSPEVTDWLHVFDRAHEVLRRSRADVDQRGTWSRVREDHDQISPNPRVPSGLPINTFNARWFKAQSAMYTRSHLRPLSTRYKFEHNPNFLRCDVPF